MSGGTITTISGIKEKTGTVTATKADEYKEKEKDTAVFKKILVDDFGEQFLFGGVDSFISEQKSTGSKSITRTVPKNWEDLSTQVMEEGEGEEEEKEEEIKSIWDSSKLKNLMEENIGSPIELTREEADEVVRLAYGSRPDLPPGRVVVGEVREILGQSLIERIEKEEK